MLSEDLINKRAETLVRLYDILIKKIETTEDGVERAALAETLAKTITFSYETDLHSELTEMVKKHHNRATKDPLSDL